jgi:DNA-binding beta-propeller fold protein YncE
MSRCSAIGLVLLVACSNAKAPPAAQPPTAPVATPVATPVPVATGGFTRRTIALPGASPAGVMMDYLLFDPRTNTVWVPAGNTGSVDVVDASTGAITRIEGFATKEVDGRRGKRTVGPSGAALGAPGTVYIGSRGDSSICAVDEKALKKGTCTTLDAMPDGIEYVASTHEVWVTTPGDKSLRILDEHTLAQKARLVYDGEPEGYAIDVARGRFFTNLEDKDLTLVIDLVTHKTIATWHPSCGEDGPHGLRFADADARLIVACSAELHVLDAGKDGAIIGKVAIGDGVDDLDFIAASHTIYAGGGEAGELAVVDMAPTGALTLRTKVPTAPGARNGVVTSDGTIYLQHARGSELVVIAPEKN